MLPKGMEDLIISNSMPVREKDDLLNKLNELKPLSDSWLQDARKFDTKKMEGIFFRHF